MWRLRHGFTIVELMVTVAVAGIMVVATVGLYLTVLSQVPLINERNTLSTNLQNALNRINNDVRLSSNVSLYNLTPDPYAPTSTAGYSDVPGPTPDDNDQYYWRMGPNRLLLNQTPVDNSGNPIYDNAQYAVGAKNTIIYYVANGALYRRVIAAPYGTNSISTTSCTRVAAGGCIQSDIKILDNLDTSLGQAAFSIAYYDKNGNQIPYTAKNNTGGTIPDYSGFPLTRSIGITIKLTSTPVGSGTQTVSLSNTARMQFRSQLNVVPAPVVNPPYVPPTNGVGSPGLIVGPGGLVMNSASVQGGDMYIKGKLTMSFSNIGGSAFWFGATAGNGAPINLNVANIGCGTGTSFPIPCGSTSPPITMDAFISSIYGNVCARDQTYLSGIHPYGTATQGLIVGCVPPDIDLPSFDKAAFTGSMTNGATPGSTGSCTNGNISWLPNHTYTSDVTVGTFCTATVTGNTYIQGNLTGNNIGKIKVAESAGKVRPIIVVNGKINLSWPTSVTPNSYGTTPYFVSFFSADSSCSGSDSCNTITPAMLKATLDSYTGASAPITLTALTASGSSFYSYFGEVNVGVFSTVGAAAGQRVTMDAVSTVVLNGGL